MKNKSHQEAQGSTDITLYRGEAMKGRAGAKFYLKKSTYKFQGNKLSWMP